MVVVTKNRLESTDNWNESLGRWFWKRWDSQYRAPARIPTDEGSSLINHSWCDDDDSIIARRELEAVPVAKFCKSHRSAGGKLKYVTYTDIILVDRKLPLGILQL